MKNRMGEQRDRLIAPAVPSRELALGLALACLVALVAVVWSYL